MCGAALLEVFNSGVLPDGRKGFFQPDFFHVWPDSLSESRSMRRRKPCRVSRSGQITAFQRQGLPETSGLTGGFLMMNRLEIARLDNDPNFPEHGIFKLGLGGGR